MGTICICKVKKLHLLAVNALACCIGAHWARLLSVVLLHLYVSHVLLQEPHTLLNVPCTIHMADCQSLIRIMDCYSKS